MYPIAPLERGPGSATVRAESSPLPTLEQRLMHAHQLVNQRLPGNAANDAMEKAAEAMQALRRQQTMCALLTSQWKAQIYMPDPDDPSACPGLEINPSW
ncbi:hypothetical protein [Burkholderia ubonensis]|uniref:hypothetical protein n=1 Tax=Burkholderia ubonensis TaxID=101571 RepID=UPI0012FCAEB5|nr:hypothetical protein [Burkholderia ubonensis]